jgi:hypothetical protein
MQVAATCCTFELSLYPTSASVGDRNKAARCRYVFARSSRLNVPLIGLVLIGWRKSAVFFLLLLLHRGARWSLPNEKQLNLLTLDVAVDGSIDDSQFVKQTCND